MRRGLVALCFLLLLVAHSHGAGSFLVDVELRPILDQVPAVRSFLLDVLEIQPSGWANRIGNNVNPLLGGTRVGPYCLRAKPGMAPGAYTLEVCVNTEVLFFDAEGRRTTIQAASRVEEKFLSVEIKPWVEK
jgi:hypothetical protein